MSSTELIELAVEYIKKNRPEYYGTPDVLTEHKSEWTIGDKRYILEHNVKYHRGFIFGYFGGEYPNGFQLERFYI